jgi:hypothetical protein
MSWHKEWDAIQKVITELNCICSEFVSALDASSSDTFSTIKTIAIPMAESLGTKIEKLGERYESQLPVDALNCISSLGQEVSKLSTAGKNSIKTPAGVAHMSTIFRNFRAEFTYLTSDLDGMVVRQTARAFTHLQGSIIADPAIRKKWIDAFNERETTCEKLGAVHLLLHGVWSFKADSAGGRTDLILGEPLKEKNLSEIYLAAEGLVLTEWKRVVKPNDTKKASDVAFEQAQIYANSNLAAIELKKYRYLVLVSIDYLKSVPDDREQEGVIYKHINIAVDPSSPSKAARKYT